MNIKAIKQKAKKVQKRYGGFIFAFPVEEENPFSKYAVVIDTGLKFMVFPELLDITETAQCVLEATNILNRYKPNVTYEKDVRFIFHEAQKNAPSVTMRRLTRGNSLM